MESAFDTAWFTGDIAPSNFQFGVYGGKGVGLSTGGDAVNLFNTSGNHITGVTFGVASTASPIATFDNTASGSSVSTLSQVGVNGAFLSANGAEIGSPVGAWAHDPAALAFGRHHRGRPDRQQHVRTRPTGSS